MSLSADDIALMSRLLDAAEPLAPEQREPWLSALPATQQHLVPLLRRAWATSALQLPGWPALACPAASGDDLQAGTEVGPYRLLRPLGAGGMGTVWLAERADGLYARHVALKLPRWPLGPELALRAERERRIGALLEHPHIARLYDAGDGGHGRPYIAMEFVDGVPVDLWCEHRGREPRAVLALFEQVVRAVAHAHARRVVHRDLKPANILVDAQDQSRLLDFGIATLLAGDTGSLTQELGRRMTLRYASPEQLNGEAVGTASDVYSLGVTLHELLTGTLPYAAPHDDAEALHAAILRGELQPPSRCVPARARALRGDVDAIVGQALRRRPAERYASAQAMAEDIARWLQGQPLQARHPGVAERAGRWLARRPGVLAAGLAALVAASVLAAGQWRQHQRAQAEAERTREVTEFAGDLLRLHAASSSAAPLQSLVGLVERRFADRPDLQAALYGAIGRVYEELGVGRLAISFAERQRALLDRGHPPPELRTRALLQLAAAHGAQGRYADARRHAEAALQAAPDPRTDTGLAARAALAALLMSAGRQDEARRLLDDARAAWPERPPSLALAQLLDGQARLLEIDNRYLEAEALWLRALDVARRAGGGDSPVANRIRVRLALEAMARNRLQLGRAQLDEAVASLSQGGDAGRVQAALARSRYAERAFAQGSMGHEEAMAMIQQALDTVHAWGDALPAQVAANIEVRLGVLALMRGDLAQAAPLLGRAAPVAEEATDGLIDLRWLASHQGLLARAQGRHGEARRFLQLRLDLRVRSGAGRMAAAAFDWVQLAHNELMAGNLAAASAVLERAPGFPSMAGDRPGSAEAYAHAVREQRARIALQAGRADEALALLPPDYGLTPEDDVAEPVLATYALRGEVLCAAGQPARGLPLVQASVAQLAAHQHPASPALARLRATAGLCLLSLGRRTEARRQATLARAAFDAQPQVSDWFRAPLRALERQLRN